VVAVNECCKEMPVEDVKPLTYSQAIAGLSTAVDGWVKAGMPMVSGIEYASRAAVCRSCPKNQYKWFQCLQCKCVVYVKAKLATESCPHSLWPRS